MSALVDLRLVRVFAFYLATIFLIGVLLRIRQYLAIMGLVRSFHSRWPQLFRFITQQTNLFLTWGTVFPSLLTQLLLGVHLIASNYIWPTAELPIGELLHFPWLAAIVGVCTLPMVVIDIYLLTMETEIDRPLLEKSFDQAEYWLSSWTGKVVRVISFGSINPQEMVRTEVRAALQQVSQMLNVTLWWMSIQTGSRIVCGVALWVAYWLINHGS
jgi:hypothetical protein